MRLKIGKSANILLPEVGGLSSQTKEVEQMHFYSFAYTFLGGGGVFGKGRAGC